MSSEVKDLKKQQRQVQNTFDSVHQFIRKFKADKHQLQIQVRLEMLEAAMKKFYTVRRKLEILSEEADEKEASDSKESSEDRAARMEALIEKREEEYADLSRQTEDSFCEMKSILQGLQAESQSSSSSSSKTQTQDQSCVQSRVKLPEIRLPNFGGKTRDWVTFRDMFRSLIHRNEQLTEMDKFTYLRSSLIGEALQEIDSIEMSAVNYPVAWEVLQKRYENKKLIVKAHLDALFAEEPMKRENYEALNHLISEYDRNLQMLEKIGEAPSNWSTILVYMVCSRLDSTTLRHWESHHSSKNVPSYDELMIFLRAHCSVLQSITPAKLSHPEIKRPKFPASHTFVQSKNDCPFCGEGSHSAFKCQRFLTLRIPERYEKVKRNGLCLNCFSSSHLVRACTSGVCRHCRQKHHTLLHLESTNNRPSSSQHSSSISRSQNRTPPASNQQTQPHAQNQTTRTPIPGPSTSSFPITNTNSLQYNNSLPTTDPTPFEHINALPATMLTPLRQVLLSTALVRVMDPYGNTHLARALLDSCSEYCFITTNLSRKLKLTEAISHLSVAGIGGSTVQSTKMVEASIGARSTRISPYTEVLQLHVLPKLTSKLPTQSIDVTQLAIPNDITLADPQFFDPGLIEVIIGAEHYYDILADGKIKLAESGPTLQNTVFGWVVSGCVSDGTVNSSKSVSYPCSTVELRGLLTNFWELESCNIRSTFSVEETACEEIYDRTTVRDVDGKFIVTLPKKEHIISQLGDSQTIALRRFYGLERRFSADNNLKKLYTEFIEEYLSMGHMIEAPEDIPNQSSYYLPHHAVLKPDSTTTKLRVVFDASCRSSSGISLNDGLMVGPVVQQDLLSIVLRFRFRKYALIADVAKMYRMVKLTNTDHPLQRILWRNSTNEPVQCFQLTTVTYGTASAPYLATKCIQRLAIDAEHTHPLAAQVARKDFYVDDLLSGSDNVETGKQLVEQLIDLMNTAGFNLRKWSSNNQEILADIPSELRDDRRTLELDPSSTVKTLGLIWEPAVDNFHYAVPRWSTETTITKRVVLADTARIFDPLGLIGPVVVQAKIFLQELWKLKCDWDEPLKAVHQEFWLTYRRNLTALESLVVPRWVGFTDNASHVEFHGFCDASEAAYGACLYLRTISPDGSVSIRLITAKSKVAPIEDITRRKNKQSIPRLELSSALLLSHLYEKVRESTQISATAYFWTDSMIVKCWLSSLPSRWQTFVANRVSEILHITKDGSWNHVSGEDNPADIISRGMIPAQLQYQSIWFEGPLWLRFDRSSWPISAEIIPEVENNLLEERTTVSLSVQTKPINEIFRLRSSLPDLVRLIALIRRFIHNTRMNEPSNRHIGLLTFSEHNEASTVLVRVAQRESFPAEMKDLSNNRPIKQSSKIVSLNPIIVGGVIRVGGRLANAPLSENRKHPIILHHHHPFTRMIVEHYHRKYFHAGQQFLIATIREKFWPTNVRSLARKVIFECTSCFRNKPTVHQQLMADLPADRVNPAAAFVKTGVDYCGPFFVRYPGRRTTPIKCFVSIFVCLTTKAVHMEVVADLTTQAFLAALKRFVSIRGKPSVITCDNATNFVGANRELEELRLKLSNQQFQHTITRDCENEGIEFKFIPPRTPNFGGLWEAAVKSFKTQFRRTIGTKILTYDEMHTVVQQLAAILNSRPLTPLSNDPNDFEALTPGHFLVGRPLVSVPEPDLQEIPENRLSLWQKSQSYVQQVWRKWKTHYLSDLHNRTKWTQKRNNLTNGTLVLVKEDNLPPQRWKLGRIVGTFPGSDGNIRVVTVRTKDGEFKRGISKVCVLPIRDNYLQSSAEEI